jgi:uncharacterized membrane protein
MNIPLDNPLFLIPFTTGLIFIIAGFILLKFPPKKINSLYGYRTNSSMKNKERWNFAQKYSAIELTKLGGLLTLSGLLGFLYRPSGKTALFLGLGLMILMVVILLLRVEKSIKRKFEKEKDELFRND